MIKKELTLTFRQSKDPDMVELWTSSHHQGHQECHQNLWAIVHKDFLHGILTYNQLSTFTELQGVLTIQSNEENKDE